MEDILTVLPFGGTVDLVQIKGSTVKKAFEHAVHRYGSMSGEFLQVSGLFSQVYITLSSTWKNLGYFIFGLLQASMSSTT